MAEMSQEEKHELVYEVIEYVQERSGPLEEAQDIKISESITAFPSIQFTIETHDIIGELTLWGDTTTEIGAISKSSGETIEGYAFYAKTADEVVSHFEKLLALILSEH
jgi:hypothetical protein